RGFDGLAAPPVREMDVFSQASPPAAATEIFADTSAAVAEPITPMDLVQPEAESLAPAPKGLSDFAEALAAAPDEIGHPPTFGDTLGPRCGAGLGPRRPGGTEG